MRRADVQWGPFLASGLTDHRATPNAPTNHSQVYHSSRDRCVLVPKVRPRPGYLSPSSIICILCVEATF
jgi:hypothetical protein